MLIEPIMEKTRFDIHQESVYWIGDLYYLYQLWCDDNKVNFLPMVKKMETWKLLNKRGVRRDAYPPCSRITGGEENNEGGDKYEKKLRANCSAR